MPFASITNQPLTEKYISMFLLVSIPSISKTKHFPHGHLGVILGSFDTLTSYFGMFKGKVYPAHGLPLCAYHDGE